MPARLLPQLADTAELVAFAKTLPGLFASVLVPNLKGAERALESGADLMLVPLSASHAHSLANLRKTPDDVVAEIARIRAARDAAGSTLPDRGRHQHRVRLHDPGPRRAVRSAAPAAGGARRRRRSRRPRRHRGLRRSARWCSDLFERALAVAGDRLTCGHFHDTRGLGMANVFAAWKLGIPRFDACLAGIGGCPHAPGASGNVTTEDVVYMFASMGVPTGQDFDRLIALRAKVAGWLDGETLHGTLWRAGLPKTMRGAPAAS